MSRKNQLIFEFETAVALVDPFPVVSTGDEWSGTLITRDDSRTFPHIADSHKHGTNTADSGQSIPNY
jgi:hypothetical protein